MSRGESILVPCKDGRTVHVKRVGSGQIPCLFIHGFSDAGYIWDGFMRAAMTSQTLLAVDLAGHGGSSWRADGHYDAEGLVADLLEVVDAFELSRLVLVGHSLGGNLALRLAQRLGSTRVAGVAVVDTTPKPSALARAHLLAELAESARQYSSPEEYLAQLAPKRPLVSAKNLQQVAANALRPQAEGGWAFKADPQIKSLLRGDEDDDLWSVIRAVHSPVLVVRGGISGVLSQALAEQMVRELPQGKLHVVSGAGHCVMLDNPLGFRDAVAPFVTGFACASPKMSASAF